MRLDSVKSLCRSRQIALTTVAATDREYCDRLQTSLVRGSHELLYWGAGPRLRRGDIVALYTPKSEYLPSSEHSCVRRLYFAAADSTPGSGWNQHVFLHRRVNLDRPLGYKVLTDHIGLTFRHIVNAGTIPTPMAEDVAIRFLTEVARRCTDGLARVRELARDAKANPEICISYSGHDWTKAHRVKLWLEDMRPFFVSPVGHVLPIEEEPLVQLLKHTFSNASVVVCLIPSKARLSKWVRLEIQAALAHAKRVIFVRTDAGRPWPPLPGGCNVRRVTLQPTRERQLVDVVKREVLTARRLTGSSGRSAAEPAR